MRSRIYWNCYF